MRSTVIPSVALKIGMGFLAIYIKPVIGNSWYLNMQNKTNK